MKKKQTFHKSKSKNPQHKHNLKEERIKHPVIVFSSLVYSHDLENTYYQFNPFANLLPEFPSLLPYSIASHVLTMGMSR